jgi:hypothetical protein
VVATIEAACVGLERPLDEVAVDFLLPDNCQADRQSGMAVVM